MLSYLHHFLEAQPNLNWHNPQVIDAMLGEVEFWLERGVDGLRLDAIVTLLHDPELRDNPPASEISGEGMTSRDMPHTHQQHLYDRDHPDIMKRFAQLRALVNRYPARFLLGEIAECADSIDVAARYTQGEEALHTSYTFQMIKDQFGVEQMRAVIGRFESEIGTGWTTHAFGNHDSKRVVSRWEVLPRLGGRPESLGQAADGLPAVTAR